MKDLKDALSTVGLNEECLLKDQIQRDGINGEREMSINDSSKVNVILRTKY